MLAAGRGVFELTGYRDGDLIGREVAEALALSDAVADRRRARVGRAQARPGARDPDERRDRKAVDVDFFPAYDDDGGMLVALTPR